MKKVGIVIGVIVLVLLVILLVGGVGMMIGNGRFGMMGGGFFGGSLSPLGFGFRLAIALFRILFWAFIIGGVAWLIVNFTRGGSTTSNLPATAQTPLDILKARYAKGEITKEQFEQMKQDVA